MNTYNSGGESETKKQGGGKRKSSTLAQATAPKPKATSKKAKTPSAPPEVMVQSIIALATELGGQVGVNHAQKLVVLLPEWTVVDGKATRL